MTRMALVEKSETTKYRVMRSLLKGLTRMGGELKYVMLRTLLHNLHPIEKLSLELGRRADIYR